MHNYSHLHNVLFHSFRVTHDINLPTGRVLASLVPKQAGLPLPRKHEHGVTEDAQSLEPAEKVTKVTVEPSLNFKSTMLGSITSSGGMRSTKKEKPWFISYVQFWLPNDGKNFVLVTIYNHKNQYGYQLPYKKLLRDYPQLAHDELDMFGMVALRDPKYGDQEIPRFQENNSRYYKECLLVFFDGSISIDDFATQWCLTLSNFANQATNVHFPGDRNKFIYEENTFEQDKPVNYYLLTKETLLLLKKIYDPSGTRKSEIEKDTELLTKYFGDAKKGLSVLNNLTEEQWVHLSN
jgi:hypothetical protein